jgi:hypothetical protein
MSKSFRQRLLTKMAKIPTSGGSVSTLYGDEDEFKRVLSRLYRKTIVDDAAVHGFYSRLERIADQWLSDQGRADTSPVARALSSIHRNLHKVEKALSGSDTGLHNSNEIEVVTQLKVRLAKDPKVGSIDRAWDLLTAFRHDARRVAHASLVTAAELSGHQGSRGRTRLNWYDDFTAVLLDIADKAEAKPDLYKDRQTGIRSGWLLEAALALEAFLYPAMWSQSAEACGKRLERSKARLEDSRRQN